MGFEEEIGSFGDLIDAWNRHIGVESDVTDESDGGHTFNADFSKWGWTLSDKFSKWGWTLADKKCDRTDNDIDIEFNFIDWNVIGISSDTIFTYESGRAATTH